MTTEEKGATTGPRPITDADGKKYLIKALKAGKKAMRKAIADRETRQKKIAKNSPLANTRF